MTQSSSSQVVRLLHRLGGCFEQVGLDGFPLRARLRWNSAVYLEWNHITSRKWVGTYVLTDLSISFMPILKSSGLAPWLLQGDESPPAAVQVGLWMSLARCLRCLRQILGHLWGVRHLRGPRLLSFFALELEGGGWGGIYNNVIGTATHVRDATLLYALFDFIHIHTYIMLALPHIRHATLL